MALTFEDNLYSKSVRNIAGLDEAGRGPLLGPVVAACVILPKDFDHPLIKDSKALTEKQREEAFKIIKENALAVSFSIQSSDVIDKLNILEATRKAFQESLNTINHDYDLVITDYMNIETNGRPLISLVKGDAKCRAVAAASIIAKVTRDHLMDDLDRKYPEYGIKNHKGYGTKEHLEALEKYGPIPHVHRYSFGPIKKFLSKQLHLF